VSGDPVREEAERLVAAAIAAVSVAARGLSGGSGNAERPRFATGSDECCVCPVCRLIAAMREPNADLAERLATGAGDLAVAVAGVLRTLGGPAPAAGHQSEEDPWHRATAEEEPPPAPRKKVAKKAVKRAPAVAGEEHAAPPSPVEDTS
jgi:hypothetical protein